MDHRPWPDVVRDPQGDRHIVQLYRDERFLQRAVGDWVAHGIGSGGSAILVGLGPHVDLVMDHLRDAHNYDGADLRRQGVLVVAEANDALARLMDGSRPDPARFRATLGPLLAKARARSGNGDVRVWGEMVDILAKAGQADAARALEELWESEIARAGFKLLCSYEADNLDPATHAGELHEAISTHDRLLPEEDEPSFDLAVARALLEAVGEREAAELWTRYSAPGARRRTSPAEALVVGLLRDNPKLGLHVLGQTRVRLVAAARSHPKP